MLIVDSDRGDEVGEPARLGDVHRQRLQIVGQQRRERHHLLEVRLDVARQRVDLEPVGVVGVFGRRADPRAQIRLGRDDLIEREPRQPLDDQPQAAVGQLEHLVDVRRGADRIEIRLRGSSTAASRWVNTAISLPLAIASSIRRTELSRATASGMNEFGNSTVSRSGRIGSSAGIDERPIADRDVLGLEVLDLIAHGDLLSIGDVLDARR